MSVEAMTWAFLVPLPPCPKSVLVALANRADEDGYCWPGIGDLGRRTGWNARSIQRALRLLEEEKLIAVAPRFKDSKRQDSNLYCLAVGVARPTTGCGESDTQSPIGVTHRRGEGDTQSPIGVTHRRGEGDTQSPKSSSEQSVEQSDEVGAVAPTVVSDHAREEAWEGYAGAYRTRYGVEPVRNRSVNAMFGKLVGKLGEKKAPLVAAFYVTHQSSWYTEKMHPVNLLLQDAEKLHTEWATGKQALSRFDQQKPQQKTPVPHVKSKCREEPPQPEPEFFPMPDEVRARLGRSIGNIGKDL